MKSISLKTEFEKAGLKNVYSRIFKRIGQVPSRCDDFADEILRMRQADDEQLPKVCQIVNTLDREAYFDPFKYLLVKYEAEGRYEDNEKRIELLSEMTDYNYERVYVVELACLYLEQGNKMKARRLILNASSGFDEFPEKDLLLGDIKNGTDEYRIYLRSSEKPEPEGTQPEIPTAGETEQKTGIDPKYIPLQINEEIIDDSDIPEFILDAFKKRHLTGMRRVKEQLAQLYNRLKVEQLRRQHNLVNSKKIGLNFVLYGNPGTGKTVVARLIGDVLYKLGLVETNTMIETDRSGLVDPFIGGTDKKTAEVLEKSIGKTLFIDEAYTLYEEESERDSGREAINTILKFVEDHRGDLCVILAGYKAQMENMMKKANKGFDSRFDTKIEIPDYTNEELINILVTMADASDFKISADAKNTIIERIERQRIDDTFSNARYMRDLLNEANGRFSKRLSKMKTIPNELELTFLLKEDFLPDDNKDEKDVDYLEELNSMIGLENVKKEVQKLAHTAAVMSEKRRRGMENKGMGTLHLAFTGNPGTGKTTVARLIGKIYKQLGILKRGDVYVECNRAQLVGEYQGHTAIKVHDVVSSALGGVLFIDEAYSLVNGKNDNFGMEAVDTLIAEMENNRDNLVVIIAGYKKELREFMDVNPGMSSRISHEIEFEDYTDEDMADIFLFEMKKRDYDISAISRDRILDLVSEKCHKKGFENGRGVRKLCDEIIHRCNSRLASSKNISELSDSDFKTITEDDLNVYEEE